MEQRSGWADAPSVHFLAFDLVRAHPVWVSDISKIQKYMAGLFKTLGQCPICESHDFCDSGPLFLDTTREENEVR